MAYYVTTSCKIKYRTAQAFGGEKGIKTCLAEGGLWVIFLSLFILVLARGGSPSCDPSPSSQSDWVWSRGS